jgi:hypothetical protein
MDRSKKQLIMDLIKNRPDLTYVQISLLAGVNLTAVHTVARNNGCQRKRGGGAKKPVVQTQRA